MSVQIHCVEDARRLAKKRLPSMVFDYIDGAAGDESGEKRNREAIRNLCLQPRVLNNVESRSVSVDVFGTTAELPVGICPMGMCNLSAPGADLMLARLAARYKVPVGASTAASTSLEEIIQAADGNAWFQLYFSGDWQASNKLLQRAKTAGYSTLVVTVDVPEVGRRPRELQHNFKMPFKPNLWQLIDCALHPHWSMATLLHGQPQLANFGGDFGQFDRTASRAGADWQLLATLRQNWSGKLVVKGVLSVDDALSLKAAGADAVQVSSHGGRQLQSVPAAIEVLAAVRKAVGPDYPVFYDSGIRSGEDAIKAYAAGASFVLAGRPWLYAVAAAGEPGLQQMAEVFHAEASITLAQLGLKTIAEISSSQLYKPT